jgi:hypothetical protein
MMEAMARNLERASPSARLRVWTGGRGPGGHDLAVGEVVVEWAGQSGHPSSYALVGCVRRGDQVVLAVATDGPGYPDALAGRADSVAFGLPCEYRAAVGDVLRETGYPVEVTVAAHGSLGSSRTAFRRVAGFLVALLGLDLAAVPDETIWRAWDDGSPRAGTDA